MFEKKDNSSFNKNINLTENISKSNKLNFDLFKFDIKASNASNASNACYASIKEIYSNFLNVLNALKNKDLSLDEKNELYFELYRIVKLARIYLSFSTELNETTLLETEIDFEGKLFLKTIVDEGPKKIKLERDKRRLILRKNVNLEDNL